MKKNRLKSKKVLVSVSVLCIIVASVFFYGMGGKEGPAVEGYKVDLGSVRDCFKETAEVTVKEEKIVYSKVTSNIVNLNVTVGDQVKEGQVLAEFDSDIVELQIKSLNAEIEALNATYLEAQKKTDKERVNQARASLRSAKNTYDENTRTHENNVALHNEGAISQDVINKSENLVNVSKENYNVALNALNLLTKDLSENQKVQYEARITALEANLEILEKQYGDMKVVALTDGIVLEKFASQGEYLIAGQPILELGVADNLTLRSDILTADSVNITTDTVVELEDDDNGLSFQGQVGKIYPKAFNKVSDLGIVQKRVTVEIDNESFEGLKIGYELDAKFVVEARENVLRIPDRCIFEIDDEKNVFAVEEGKLVLKTITIGLEGDEYVEVLEGLSADDVVVLSPEEDLDEGIEVEVSFK